MFSDRREMQTFTLDDGSIFLDLDGRIFLFVLDYLRYGKLDLTQILHMDRTIARMAQQAEFLDLPCLVGLLSGNTKHKQENSNELPTPPISAQQFLPHRPKT
eukprot:comp21510_c0_seq1/m.29845 comp21510_c0_seq1/g.29845  ORF comp21510_c0_seq1/g.29845 comp21510_c0_seq1/m.29845 type:complete len:102 (-) comp21510_c0_seq1:1084-1389(-)